MSTILKALKKLEQEKVARGESRAEIACDILKSPPPKRRSVFPGWMVMVGLSVLVAAGTIVLLFGGLATVPTTSAGKKVPSGTPVVVTPTTVAPGPGERDLVGDIRQPLQAEPAHAPAPVIVEVAVAEEAVAEEAVAEEAVAEEATLFVSGIAYHDDSEARLAVVNDLPVMEGTAVEGAIVLEIRPDRVLFSRSGETFEVPIDGSF